MTLLFSNMTVLVFTINVLVWKQLDYIHAAWLVSDITGLVSDLNGLVSNMTEVISSITEIGLGLVSIMTRFVFKRIKISLQYDKQH